MTRLSKKQLDRMAAVDQAFTNAVALIPSSPNQAKHDVQKIAERYRGITIPPSMSKEQARRVLSDFAYHQVSESLGHGRKSVIPAYSGAFLAGRRSGEATLQAVREAKERADKRKEEAAAKTSVKRKPVGEIPNDPIWALVLGKPLSHKD
ncbi:hypothetical protein [Noviherbaspirillum galbum]|uniref:Uncharacterized protein n=1 Tax=Noviherbaspirillum galbum TaxID=2709383 RepID=A0A6B3SYX1_9BURK|nr:hypothetical protein [Noviherbaspirillum galbum]NEX64906.1 hypothetical protein [Noviherbaspirillum galbum]